MAKMMMSREKAKKIMKEGMVHGEPLSKAQKGLFGLLAGGKKPTKLKRKKKLFR